MSCDLIRFKLRDVAAHSPPSNSAEHDCQASRLSINHTRNRCCQAKLEHGREDAVARSEGNPTLRCCAAGEQSSARPTPYQYRPHCRFQDIQTSKCSSLYPYSPCSYSTRREATRRLASARPICRQDVTEILRSHSVKLPQAMRHDRKETRRICASAWQLKLGGSDPGVRHSFGPQSPMPGP